MRFKQEGLLGEWKNEWSSSTKFSGEGGVGLAGGGGGTVPPFMALPSPTPSLKLWEAVTSRYSLS